MCAAWRGYAHSTQLENTRYERYDACGVQRICTVWAHNGQGKFAHTPLQTVFSLDPLCPTHIMLENVEAYDFASILHANIKQDSQLTSSDHIMHMVSDRHVRPQTDTH